MAGLFMTAGMEIRRFAAEQAAAKLDRFEAQLQLVSGVPGPEEVHDLRVAIRRFSQVLIVFKPWFPSKERKRIRRKLDSLMTRAGEVRDCDISLKLIGKSEVPGTAGLTKRLEARRKAAARRLVASAQGLMTRSGAEGWAERLQPIEDGPAGLVGQMARREMPKAARRYLKCGAEATKGDVSPVDLHRFRIEAKKFRYTLEVFEPVFGELVQTRVEQVKTIQTLLGDINDCRSARQLVQDLDGPDEVGEAIRRKQRKRTREFEAEWKEQFSSAAARRNWVQFPLPVREPMSRSVGSVGKVALGA